MEIIKAYKVKIYPNKEQQELLLKTIGSCRWIWNHYLEKKTKSYTELGENITYKEMSADMTQLRKQTDWLLEVQFQPLQQSLRNLDGAYNKFFRKRTQFPKFKSKYNPRQSFQKAIGWRLEEHKIQIQEDVAVRARGMLPKTDNLGTLTISRQNNKWFASMVAREEIALPKQYTKPIGLDMGLKDLVITSTGKKYENITVQKRKLKKLKFLQQSLARKKKGGIRRQKAKEEVSNLHCKMTNKRINYLHHVSKDIVDKNHAMIAVEDLSVANMMKNHKLARAISDASWAELVRQIEYKQLWRGGKFIKINKFFPSSKMCSNCSYLLQSLSLEVRVWICSKCHKKHDRDVNAAKNILQQARLSLGRERGDGKQSVMVA